MRACGIEKPLSMVGATRFELATPCSQSRCSTRLSYAPKAGICYTLRRKSARTAPVNEAPHDRPPARNHPQALRLHAVGLVTRDRADGATARRNRQDARRRHADSADAGPVSRLPGVA